MGTIEGDMGCSFPTKYWQPALRLVTFSRSRPTFRGLSSRANLTSFHFFEFGASEWGEPYQTWRGFGVPRDEEFSDFHFS